jgi:hypothetical protein
MESSSRINSKKKAKRRDGVITRGQRKLPIVILPLPRPYLLIGWDGTGEDKGGGERAKSPLTPPSPTRGEGVIC